MRRSLILRCLGLGVIALGFVPFAIPACAPASDSSGSPSSGGGSPGSGASGGASAGQAGTGTGGFFMDTDAASTAPSLSPAATTLVIDPGSGGFQPVTFELTGEGIAGAVWRVTNPAVGSVDQNGVFSPSGRAAGTTEVQVTIGDLVLAATVTVEIAHRQNGGTASVPGQPGAGGLGGVGGEGFGGSVDAAVATLLGGAASSDANLRMLYPYDDTVFPLGMLPPLLQWTPGSNGTFDAVLIHLTAPHYDYQGVFGRPALLEAGADFVRHPIPPDVWQTATRSAAGGTLTLEVIVAAGGVAYGPIRQSYRIALAPVTGKIFYQAYNTALAQNYDAVAVTGARMGGATLSIGVGAESPELVAGRTSDDHSGCRVCHSVSAYGDRMLVQHGEDYSQTASIDLRNGNAEANPYAAQILAWAGIYPDGSLGLGNSVSVGNTNEASGTTGLYDLTTGAPRPSPGLAEFATQIGLPAFSHDGRKVAFSIFAGPSTTAVGTPDGRQLVSMDFDVGTGAFSNPTLLWQASSADERPAWPTFMPGSNAVVFQRRWAGTTDEIFATRFGARGELWWVDLASGVAAPLDRVNGAGYLPDGPNNHGEDERLNYEPSISPVASGGYAWMVFLSRRMYGNVATIDPWSSDPRDHDLEANVTPKKLWMAAISLDAAPGTDPSHPAFYIPGQELHGVNSRPFFALDPCVSDAGTCSTGVDCCSGFCRDGYCVAPPTDECSGEGEKCETSEDCCSTSHRCVGGFCAVIIR